MIIAIVGYQMGLSWLQLVIHDWSKFTPNEWRGYFKKTKKSLNLELLVKSNTTTHWHRPQNHKEDDEEEEYGFLYHQNRILYKCGHDNWKSQTSENSS